MKILGYELFKKAPVKLAAQGERQRVSYRIKNRRQFRAEMQIDVYKQAIEMAEHHENPNRVPLLSLYHQAMKDAHLLSQVQKRKNKTLKEGFALFNAAGNVDEEKTKLIKKPWFYDLIEHALDAEFYGHSLVEIMPMVEGEIKEIKLIPRMHVVPETGEIVLDEWREVRIPYRDTGYKWLLEFGEHDDLGLLQSATKHVIYKSFSETDWSRFNEKFGIPFIYAKTEETRKEELDIKADMLANFGSNAWALLDAKDEIGSLQLANDKGYETFSTSIDKHDAAISKVINGAVTGEASQGGSRAKEETGKEESDEIAESDMRYIGLEANFKIIPKLIELGYPLQGLEFDFLINRADDEDDKDDAEEGKEAPGKKPVATKSKMSAEVASLYASGCCPSH